MADERDKRRIVDPARAANEIVAMIERDDQPTIGWWRRNTVPPPVPRRIPGTPLSWRRVLTGMLASGWSVQVAADTVADLALADDIDAEQVRVIVTAALEAV